jgi:peptide/nickel transport system substrate-binding protein
VLASERGWFAVRRGPTFVLALSVLLAACTSSGDGSNSAGAATSPTKSGGTVRVAAPGQFDAAAWDPAFRVDVMVHPLALELYRCCVLRRLFSYSGSPVEQGGGELRPDLAAEMPEASPDGFMWTIDMKPGLRYAPPFADREIVAGDIVEAIERIAHVRAYWGQYFSPVLGYDDFAEGRADTIRGLDTPDAHTLVVHLDRPTGDLPDRLSLPGTAPIPPGAADGHDGDYVKYLIASGPYMIEGAPDLTPWRRPAEQSPAEGVSGDGVILVRNPSWDRVTDELRLASPDRIRIELLASDRQAFDRFEAGRIEVWPWPRAAQVRSVAGGDLAGLLVKIEGYSQVYAPLNLAVPPFDDVHVRRAVNLAFDRELFVRGTKFTDSTISLPTWHLVPPLLEGSRIDLTWRPTWARDASTSGDPEAAAEEMRRSRYDADGDGRCDGPACVVRSIQFSKWPKIIPYFTEPLGRLGITLRVIDPGKDGEGQQGHVPAKRFGFTFHSGWAADYFNASTFFLPTWYGPGIADEGNWNLSLLGATPQQLDRWGYEVQKVPTIDALIERCMELTGESQTVCWTALDQRLMERVVPTIPLALYGTASIVSSRVLEAPVDVSLGAISYDRILLAPGSGDRHENRPDPLACSRAHRGCLYGSRDLNQGIDVGGAASRGDPPHPVVVCGAWALR